MPKGFGSTPPSPRETPSYSGMVRAEISYPINIHKLNKAANNSIFLNHNRYIAKTKIKKLVIKKNMGWCNDSRSKNYNKLITFPFRYGYEKLFRPDNIYDVILVLDYNINPIQKNKGSAIFIHIAKKDYRKTEGCVAINK